MDNDISDELILELLNSSFDAVCTECCGEGFIELASGYCEVCVECGGSGLSNAEQ